MIVKVSPLLRLPSTVDVFDYFVPPDLESELRLGQLVSIPWRSGEVTGVVLELVASERPPLGPLLITGGEVSSICAPPSVRRIP